MQIFRSRAAAAFAAAAALSLTATPAMARGWHRYHHDRIDTGDVFAGLLVFGGIAALAAAASKSNKDRQAREDAPPRDYPDSRYQEVPPQRYDGQGYDNRPEYPGGSAGADGRSNLSVDGAVDACVGAVEQGRRTIDGIDTVSREGDGWRVTGRDSSGGNFACSVDRDGRLRGVSGA